MDPAELTGHRRVERARERLRARDDTTLAEQLRIAQVPAPPFGEAERAGYLLGRFRALGVEAAHIDDAGNLLAPLPAAGAGAPLVLAAHLDTVFPADTPLQLHRRGERLHLPGITDNARGLATLLALADAVLSAGVRTRRPVLLAATVGEEGAGDLRGVKHLLRAGSALREAAGFVALDGCGLRRVVHRAVGSRRLRVELRGPGGHSWADAGAANPAHALGQAIASLAALPLPETPPTALTVARLGGGTSINAVPAEAWMEVDLRSEAAATLAALEVELRGAVGDAVAAENERRRTGTPLAAPAYRLIGDRPAGETPAEAPLVRAALAATAAVGARAELAASSTDANLPMALGIPAVALGCGGEGAEVHTPREWYSNAGGVRGLERALLLALAVAGVEG